MIPIRNIYHMLAYVFHLLKDGGYVRCATEDFERVSDLLAEILIRGISKEIKRGLQKGYSPISECTGNIKGKINMSESINSLSHLNAAMVCEYDVFDENCYQNRILKTTVNILLKNDIATNQKQQLRKLMLYFSQVEELEPHHINWHLHFNRNNQNYQLLMYVCEMVIKGLLQTQDDGRMKLRNFINDERLHHLYEKFILHYYQKEHPAIRASSEQVPWAVTTLHGGVFLPTLQTDVILRHSQKTLIIDAKFYNQNTCSKYGGSAKLHTDNVNQIYVYVDNYRKIHPNEEVQGMVLYAKTDSIVQPYTHTSMFVVKTLDLNEDFDEISRQLDSIALDYLLQQ